MFPYSVFLTEKKKFGIFFPEVPKYPVVWVLPSILSASLQPGYQLTRKITYKFANGTDPWDPPTWISEPGDSVRPKHLRFPKLPSQVAKPACLSLAMEKAC